MASSSYVWVRYIVGGLYLLQAAALGCFTLFLAFAGAAALGQIGAPEGAMLAVLIGFLAAWTVAVGALGVGLIKGNRIALFIAILFAGLQAIAGLVAGSPVGFFLEAAICAGLLMSKDVRSGYAD